MIIKKGTLTFVAKFFLMLVQNRISPTNVENTLTWNRVLMVAVLVAGFEIDFSCILITEINQRYFKANKTYPFRCLIIQLCNHDGIRIWHCDKLTRLREHWTYASYKMRQILFHCIESHMLRYPLWEKNSLMLCRRCTVLIMLLTSTLMVPQPPLLMPLVRLLAPPYPPHH